MCAAPNELSKIPVSSRKTKALFHFSAELQRAETAFKWSHTEQKANLFQGKKKSMGQKKPPTTMVRIFRKPRLTFSVTSRFADCDVPLHRNRGWQLEGNRGFCVLGAKQLSDFACGKALFSYFWSDQEGFQATRHSHCGLNVTVPRRGQAGFSAGRGAL